ncbi:hypothetical protein AAY473_040549 [Plecturocebus cupreus]
MVAALRPEGSGGESQGATAALPVPLVGAALRGRVSPSTPPRGPKRVGRDSSSGRPGARRRRGLWVHGRDGLRC